MTRLLVTMMIRIQEIRHQLRGHGLTSSVSKREVEGDYEPFDADWNYKDIPHLPEVHNAVDGVVIAAEQNTSQACSYSKWAPFVFRSWCTSEPEVVTARCMSVVPDRF